MVVGSSMWGALASFCFVLLVWGLGAFILYILLDMELCKNDEDNNDDEKEKNNGDDVFFLGGGDLVCSTRNSSRIFLGFVFVLDNLTWAGE